MGLRVANIDDYRKKPSFQLDLEEESPEMSHDEEEVRVQKSGAGNIKLPGKFVFLHVPM